MNYIGEHILYSKLGSVLIMLAMFFALFSAVTYFVAAFKEDKVYLRRLARSFFVLHTFMVVGVAVVLYIVLFGQYFEFNYVYQHISKDLSFGYKLSAFWAGHEGSFVLWLLFQATLGIILISTAKLLETRVMSIIALSQFFLTTLILGVTFLGMKLGNSPFALLRELPENINNPFFQNPDYLARLLDGRGLSPLLRNFWMIFHPPFLFVGFAAALLPFAFAISALWKGEFKEWLKPALFWTLFGALFLGIGIVFGGAWAYESLPFGGFWSWDPIENSSLVPWIIMMACVHLLIIAIKSHKSNITAIFFSCITFVLVLYSTFLTRSGDLFNITSAHTFKNTGVITQLVIYMITFLVIILLAFVLNYKKLKKSEYKHIFSREYFMFVGALVLLISAFQIIYNTSIPAINKLFNISLVIAPDRVKFYNNWQTIFTIGIILLMAISQFSAFGKNSFKKYLVKATFSFLISFVITFFVVRYFKIELVKNYILVYACCFTTIGSIDYILRFFRYHQNKAAGITHIGFSIFVLGALITFSKTDVLSNYKNSNKSSVVNNDNVIIYRNDFIKLKDYYVTYKDMEVKDNYYNYRLDFFENSKKGFFKSFSMYPSVQLNSFSGDVYEPYAKHFISKDVYAYITRANIDEKTNSKEYNLKNNFDISYGDSVFFNNYYIILSEIIQEKNSTEAKLMIKNRIGQTFVAKPALIYENNNVILREYQVDELGMRFKINKINAKENINIEITYKAQDFIVLKVTEFPYINIMWAGTLIMLLGFSISVYRRLTNLIYK